MPIFDLVQQKAGGDSTVTQLDVVLDSAPTVGNTLIARTGSEGIGATFILGVVGFRLAELAQSSTGTVAIWYRHVQTGDGTTVSLVKHGSAVDLTLHVEEVEGIVVPHRAANDQSAAAEVTSFSTGTTAATTVADALCCAVVGMRNAATTDHAFTNSYTLRTIATTGGAGDGSHLTVPGDLVVTATGAQETTLSWTTAARARGCICVFVAGSVIPASGYETEILSQSPDYYFRLNDVGTRGFSDLAGNTHGVYAGGHTLGADGAIASDDDKAASFDATAGTYAEAWLAADYFGDETVSLWAKTAAPAQGINTAVLLSYETDVHGTHILAPDGAGNWKLHYRNVSNVGTDLILHAIPTDTWEWICWTIDSVNGLNVYRAVDGVVTLVASALATSISRSARQVHRVAASQGYNPRFNGTVDEVASWQRVLLTTEMQAQVDAAISGGATAAPADATHGHTVESPTLTQAHVLSPASVVHAHAVGAPALTQAGVIAPNEVAHTHTVEAPALTVAGVLVPAGALHAHLVGAATLTQAGQLAPADVLHAHTVDAATLGIPSAYKLPFRATITIMPV